MYYNTQVLQTLWSMLMRSRKVLAPALKDKLINNLVWSNLNIIIFGLIMPQLGLSQNFGAFMTLTMPASCAFFLSVNCIYGLLYDVTNDGSNLRYELTLPIPQWLTFAKYGIENIMQSFIIASLSFPIGSLLMWHQVSFSCIGIIKFYCILLMSCIFSGIFALFIVSITYDFFNGLDNAWTRIIFPMWFLGGFQFSWQTLYDISPYLAYINLLNPVTYALEGCRASMMYTNSSLPYALCFCMLLLFSTVFGYVGIQRLKKRMDCL